MKKIILLVFTALMMVGCGKKGFNGTAKHITESLENESFLRGGMIVNIDSCQYVVGETYPGFIYIHHNNCRFCKERRQKELKELVEQLKEK